MTPPVTELWKTAEGQFEPPSCGQGQNRPQDHFTSRCECVRMRSVGLHIHGPQQFEHWVQPVDMHIKNTFNVRILSTARKKLQFECTVI